MKLTSATLRAKWPRAPQAVIDAVSEQSAETFAKYGVTTHLRAAHFMAQISHESGGGTIKEEDLEHYTATRITQVWPTRFHCVAEAEPYAHNGRALGNKVYNGRMGNRSGSSDGYNYRGRGLLQITGRDSYREIGGLTGLPLESRPELAGTPSVALEIAAAEFKKLGCLPYCDADNINAVTKKVNGGYIGLASRKEWYAKWHGVDFSEHEDEVPLPTPAPEEEPAPVEIPRGSDDHLPPGVDTPGKTSMSQSKTGWTTIAGGVTAVATILGNAMDAVKPLLSDPRVLTIVILVIAGAAAFVWFDRRKRLRQDHG